MLFLIFPLGASSQENVGSLEITKIDTQNYPEITLQVLALDGLGDPAQDLTSDQLIVKENDSPQTILSVEPVDAGLRLAFVIDPGDGSFNTGVTLTDIYTKMARDLQIFALERPWMLPSEDEVIILVQEGMDTNVIIPATSDPEALISEFETYIPPSGAAVEPPELGDFTRTSLLAALKEIKLARPGFIDRKEAVLLYTPGMRADLVDVAEEAISLGIPIHIILTRPEARTYWSAALRPLAEVTGGEFLESYESDDPEPLFEIIDAQRKQYIVTYQTELTTAEARQVALESLDGLIANTEYSYDIQPPVVEIVAPSTDLISRDATDEEGDPADAEPTFVVVSAQVRWPDGITRELQVARLLVDGIAVGQGSLVGDTAEITWDIRSYQTESWTPASFQVEVVDEFGLVGRSAQVTIAIRYVPIEPSGFEFTNEIIVYVTAGVALLALGLTVVLYFNRSRFGASLAEAREGLVDFVERVTGRRTALVARAYLVPLEGFDEPPSKSFEIYGTTALGRSRRHADLLFHIGEEDSPISRLHCTLLDEDDHFSIRDEDSSNGTFVNGEKLIPLQPVMLHDGDVIDVAALERGGLSLMFQLARLDGEFRGGEDKINMTKPRSMIDPNQEP
jgi:hypothetical protein